MAAQPKSLNNPLGRFYVPNKSKGEQRDKRIEAFVERLSNEWEVGVSFELNLKAFQKENKVREDVMTVIRRAVE